MLSRVILEAQRNEDQANFAFCMCWAKGWTHRISVGTLRMGNRITVGKMFHGGGTVPTGGM